MICSGWDNIQVLATYPQDKWKIQDGLDKSILKNNWDSGPSKIQTEHQEDKNSAPWGNWSKVIFQIFFFQVAASAGFDLFEFATRSSVHSKDPSQRDDLLASIGFGNFIQSMFLFKSSNFRLSSFYPLKSLWRWHGFLIAQCVMILGSTGLESCWDPLSMIDGSKESLDWPALDWYRPVFMLLRAVITKALWSLTRSTLPMQKRQRSCSLQWS